MDDSTAPSRPGVVLLVDDDDDNRAMYAEYLTFTGYDVVVARNGEEGIAAAQAHLPDVVILDLRMPGVSGQQTLRVLRADSRFAAVPVIALTAHRLEHDRAKALAEGFDAFLAKPCLLEDLARTVDELLRARRAADGCLAAVAGSRGKNRTLRRKTAILLPTALNASASRAARLASAHAL